MDLPLAGRLAGAAGRVAGRCPWLAARSWPLALVLALLLAEIVATVLDILCGPYGAVHWEERINARAGLLILCGHIGQTWNLQYMPFCGGCTAEALLSAGVFATLGPTVHAYKLIPVAFHLGLTAAGVGIGWRLGGARGALAFLVLMLGGPAVFRKLALTGWGNHAESSFFPFVAAWLLGTAAMARRPRLHAWGAGLLTGLGGWFCYTTAHALPALAVLCCWRPRGWRAAGPFALGAVSGLIPWFGYLRFNPAAWTAMHRPEDLPWHPDPVDFASLLFGDHLVRALWLAHFERAPVPALARVFWFGLWALALLGLIVAIVRGLGPRNVASTQFRADATDARNALLYGPLGLLGLLAAYIWRSDLWRCAVGAVDFFNLRYLSPVVPLLMMCAAASQAHVAPRLVRHAAFLAALALGGAGLWLRSLDWGPIRRAQIGLTVMEANESTGPLVFRGGAAPLLAHVKADLDEPMICRQDHLFSLGRELCPPDGPLPEAGEILALAGSENQRRAFLDGCTGPLSDVFRRPGHQCDIAAWDDVMDRACAALGCAGAPDLEREIAMALLRAAGPECFFGDLAEASAVHPAALDAAECRIYGEEAVRVVTGEGAIWDLGPDAAGTLLARAGDCAGDSSWHFGIGWAWAHWVSCERGDRPAALNEAVPWIEEAGLAGLDQGCERFRGRFE